MLDEMLDEMLDVILDGIWLEKEMVKFFVLLLFVGEKDELSVGQNIGVEVVGVEAVGEDVEGEKRFGEIVIGAKDGLIFG